MKPLPTDEFTVKFVDERWEVPEKTSQYFKGIFSVILNHTATLYFIPEIDRSIIDWPPKYDEEMCESETSYLDAQLTTLMFSSYVVTPSQSLAGQEEVIPSEIIFFNSPAYLDLDLEARIIFYVTSEEFSTFSQEHEDSHYSIDKESVLIQSVYPEYSILDLEESAIGQFIMNRFLNSKYLYEYHKYILGQVAKPPWKDKEINSSIQA